MIEFESFGKIPRLRRNVVITEKIDGTNGAIIIDDMGRVGAQSRNRLVTPTDDNFGFGRWVYDNADELKDILGPGRHFGEWWGKGIGRGYGLDHKRFSLFNVSRWASDIDWAVNGPQGADIGLYVVPTIFDHVPFQNYYIDAALNELEEHGSVAAEGFGRPEGIIVYHTAGNLLFKVTLEKDDEPKRLNAGMEVIGLDRPYPVAA